MQVTTSDKNVVGCLPRIRSILNALTKAEMKAALYTLDHPSEVVQMSITELAELTDTAEATIFRFCQKAGFTGYQQFKLALAGDLFSPLQTVYKEVAPGDSLLTVAGKVFQGITEGLQDTLKILDEAAVEKAVDIIAAAQRIDVYGSAGSFVIAADLENRFMRFGVPIRAYADSHMQMTSASILTPKDVVIAISHSGANRDLIDSLTMAKESGASILLITSHAKSPLGNLADIVLCGVARETVYRSEAMSSRFIHHAIVDVLFVGLMLRKQENIVANTQKIHRALAMRHV